MFKKSKLKAKLEVTELLNLQAISLQEAVEQIAKVSSIVDPAEKIIKLQELQSSIISAANNVSWKQRSIVNRRAEKKAPIRSFLIGYAPDRKILKVQKQLREQNPQLSNFAYKNKAQQVRVSEMLDETARTCDMEEAARSSWFGKAFKNCETLRDRFAAEAARKQAFGDKSQQNATPAEHPAAIPDEENTTPAKSGRDYRHLKNILK